ncbi:MAG: phosphotransferase enzyme family protein [Candidatus Tyrphobacter sp.]
MDAAADALRSVVGRFAIDGIFSGARRHGAGRVNDTFVGTFVHAGTVRRYVHQRINERAFRNVEALMENVERVTAHLREKDRAPRTLTLVPTSDGATHVADGFGGHWRTYEFIEDAASYDVAESPGRAYEAARAFGDFSRRLLDLKDPPLHETIPRFHDTEYRVARLVESAHADAHGRAAHAVAEMQFALDRRALAHVLPVLAPRVVHNDTKIDNVLFDARGRAICVVDLDTVMPGSIFSDFGDLVRTAAASAPEDEPHLDEVVIRADLFEAVASGFAQGLGDALERDAREHMLDAAEVITFEQGVRFLTDHLDGDRYYGGVTSGQNLHRARVQFALLRSMEEQRGDLGGIARRAFARVSR